MTRSPLGLVMLFVVAGGASAQVPDWVTGEPGLYVERGGVRTRVSWEDHKAALEALLEHCCHRFRCPFELPAGTVIIPGEDDKDLTRERTKQKDGATIVTPPRGQEGKAVVPGAQMSHCAIDIGSRISNDGGTTISAITSAAVSPIVTGGYVKVGDDGQVKQRVMCEHEGLQLVLELSYGHVKPRAGLDKTWIETPRGKIGDLQGDGTYTSLDPKLPTKGNHVHLEVDGVYDKSFDSEMAHNLELDGKPIDERMSELLRRRASLMNDCILPRCTGGR